MTDHQLARTTKVSRDRSERETLVNEIWAAGKDSLTRYDPESHPTLRQSDGTT